MNQFDTLFPLANRDALDAINAMSDAIPNSFIGLDPDCVLDAMHAADFPCDGRLLALNSYENRVYQCGQEDAAPLVVKFYRPGRWSNEAILEEHAFVQELVTQEIPVVPALIASNGSSLLNFKGYRFAVFASHGGRAPELDRGDTLEWLGRFIGRIHAVGAQKQYQHRPHLNRQTFGVDALAFLVKNQFIPVDLQSAYQTVANMVLNGIETCFKRAGVFPSIRLHGDCHLGNILWTEGGVHPGPHFVDFDDSRMGPAIQDLWMLLSGSRSEMSAQLCDILAGYEDFCEFQPSQLHLIEALRSLRLLHYSAWLAQRWDDPAFKLAFPWFNTQRYWQDRILELREQVALMEEAPIVI